MLKRFAFACVCVLLSCCASTMTDPAAVRSTIDRNDANAERWYASGDVDSLVRMFAEDGWQMPPNNPPLVGREAIRAFWRQALSWGKWSFSFHAEDVHVSGPIAVERGKYVLTFAAGPAAPPGMTSFTDRGNYVTHWRRESDGEWRAVWDAPVSEVPLMPAAR